MLITGPDRYKLDFNKDSFRVLCERNTDKFSGIATSKKPKLYIVSAEGKPVYVGITTQPIRSRLRLGWKAKGENGYHGYAWRHGLTSAFLDVWCHEDASGDKPQIDIETVEAEVVFLIRRAGQWPEYQTEIHFHPSKPIHRDRATTIMATYAEKLVIPS